jgi:hypothetical protein
MSRDEYSPPDFRLERKGGESRRALSLSPPECDGPFAPPPFRPETREISLGEHSPRFRRAFAKFFSPNFALTRRAFSPRAILRFFLEIFKNKVLKILIWSWTNQKVRGFFRLGSCSWIQSCKFEKFCWAELDRIKLGDISPFFASPRFAEQIKNSPKIRRETKNFRFAEEDRTNLRYRR